MCAEYSSSPPLPRNSRYDILEHLFFISRFLLCGKSQDISFTFFSAAQVRKSRRWIIVLIRGQLRCPAQEGTILSLHRGPLAAPASRGLFRSAAAKLKEQEQSLFKDLRH